MSYLVVDDNFPTHPKAVRAGGDAVYLWLHGFAYCRKYGTSGEVPVIPDDMIQTFAGVRDRKRAAAKLVAVGLWERVDGGFIMHDYLDWNDPAEKVEQYRRSARERQRRKRSRDKKRDESRDGDEHRGRDVTPRAPARARPDPKPETDTEPEGGGRAPALDEGPSHHALKQAQRFEASLSGPVPETYEPSPETLELAKRLDFSWRHEWDRLRVKAKANAWVSADWDARLQQWLHDEAKFRRRDDAREAGRAPPGKRDHDRTKSGGEKSFHDFFPKKTGAKACSNQ